MDKQKEIERMKRIICSAKETPCSNCPFRFNGKCAAEINATALVNAGYGDVKQAQREVLGKLVVKISERSAEIKTLEGKYLRADDIGTAVRFNARLQEVNRLLEFINELVKEVCGE